MLVTLLAVGVLDAAPLTAGTGPLIAPAEAIVAIPRLAAQAPVGTGIPLGAPIWPLSLDPSDTGPYAWDFSALFGDGVNIASVERLTISAAGAAVGVQIVTGAPSGPIITDDGHHVQVWFLVDAGDAAAAAFIGAGLQVAVAALVKTDQTPPREYERTAVLTVRQL